MKNILLSSIILISMVSALNANCTSKYMNMSVQNQCITFAKYSGEGAGMGMFQNRDYSRKKMPTNEYLSKCNGSFDKSREYKEGFRNIYVNACLSIVGLQLK